MPRILIGTPMHIVKDYALLRWLKSVSKLDYPVEELFLIDNSPIEDKYAEKLKILVPKIVKNIKKISVIHIDIDPKYTDPEQRVSFAREEIRKKVIEEGFDWWFSWEADTLAPPHVLTEMMKYTDKDKMIHLASPSRYDPDIDYENSFGLALVHRDLLIKFGFVYQWGDIDPLMPGSYQGTDSWFNRRVMRDMDGKFIELYGHVKPLYHLDK